MKKSLFSILLVAVATLAMTSCNSATKMIDAANDIKIACNPEVLEVVGGNIDANVSVTFPEKYFHPKAILKVTPVLIYEGGEATSTPFVYQGEKITENYKSVSKAGATIQERVHFAYVPGMEKSQLVLRAVLTYKGKDFAYPADIKVADGANTTYMLVAKGGYYSLKKDNYQEIIPETAEAQILYLINSSEVRGSQLKSQDINDFKKALKDLESDSRREVKGTEIVAYASPDGSEALNNKLSSSREKSAKKAFDKVAKKLETGEVSTRSIGEDWEGFQELVNNSSLEDKDLIIRVLSMYSDPNVREREIKNMSAVYQTLAKDVLPELRRARFITNVEYTNYTSDELKDLVTNNIDVLDEEALLRAATLVKDKDAKFVIYNQAINKYNSDRARFNAACVCLDNKMNDEAAAYISKCAKQDCKCVKNLKGVLELRKGNLAEAEKFFKESGNEDAKANLGVVYILTGKYQEAVKALEGVNDHNEGLANILVNNLDKAQKILTHKCPHGAYMRAIIYARKGMAEEAKTELETAKKRPAYVERISKDVEFAKILR